MHSQPHYLEVVKFGFLVAVKKANFYGRSGCHHLAIQRLHVIMHSTGILRQIFYSILASCGTGFTQQLQRLSLLVVIVSCKGYVVTVSAINIVAFQVFVASSGFIETLGV